ncbi:MAG TPA: SDR family NAD(P)-dependent oxidoreductase, partial [Acidimicrobiia bacterium]
MGEAIARRLASGRAVVLADFSQDQLERVGAQLETLGHAVHTVRTDVSSAADVDALARAAAKLGPIRAVVHTAGVSPVQASAEQIVAVDVLGTAHVLDAFEAHVEPGTVAVCIASMAGTMMPVDADTLRRFATTPTSELAALPELDPSTLDPGIAYALAKRANQMRVEAASVAWGRRGGRVVSISPGVIATPMGREELNGPFG